MKRRYKYRAYPTQAQLNSIAKLFGTTRAIWNMALHKNQETYQTTGKKPTPQETSKWLTTLKQDPDYHWIKDVSSVPLQQTLRDLNIAYSNYFNSHTGKRKGKRVGIPRYKKRVNRQTARFTNNSGYKVQQTKHEVGFVVLPKIGRVRFNLSRELPSMPSSVTLIKEPDNRYYVSFVVEVKPEYYPNSSTRNAGIDLGLTDLACIVYDNGERERVKNPRWSRTRATKWARAQRSLSRKVKGSKNYEKARVRVAREYRKSRDARLDHHHKLALRLVTENQSISLETLSVSGLARTRLARSVQDAGWSILTQLVEEKALVFGCEVFRVDRFAPTSQVCSVCGVRDGRKALGVRVWVCGGCGCVLDRDFNAGVNVLLAAGLVERLNACGGSVRRQLAVADPVKQEPSHVALV